MEMKGRMGMMSSNWKVVHNVLRNHKRIILLISSQLFTSRKVSKYVSGQVGFYLADFFWKFIHRNQATPYHVALCKKGRNKQRLFFFKNKKKENKKSRNQFLFE